MCAANNAVLHDTNSYSSYDARDGGPENGHRWSDKERGFGNRARFRWRDGPAYLHIDRIHALEAGIYRCRVDFKTAPTRNSLLNLTVVSKYFSIYYIIFHRSTLFFFTMY